MVGEIKKTYLAFLLFAAGLVLMPVKAFSLTASEITQKMTCTCGCSMVLAACEGSMECGPAAQITREVVHMIDQGQTKADILKFYVYNYGETILAEPTK
ncbi:MAG: cytochrome c-type biogenesis protein CcmH, partial [Candidatus Adiutricales bacterium]